MRVLVALVGLSFTLIGCACPPPHPGSPKPVRAKCALAHSQPRFAKFTKATAKTLTKTSRPVSKRSKKAKTQLAKPARPQIKPPASADSSPLLPSRKPELAPIQSPATDAESLPPVPPRKSEETAASATESHEHAVEPDSKFIAAKEKAERKGVHALTSEDVRGLSQEQIKELRGY
jgi:hypothetical protein